MEVIGSVASLLQLISCTAKIVNYCIDVKNAPQKIDELGRTSSMLLPLLYQVKDAMLRRGADAGGSAPHGNAPGPGDLIRELEECMVDISQRFEKSRSKGLLARAKFIQMEKDIQKTIDTAARTNSFLNSWLSLDIKQTTEAIDDGVRALNSRAEQEQLAGKMDRIIQHYAPVSFSEKHGTVLQERQHGTGQWFLDSPEFQSWLQSDGATMWCTGAPGAGKTVMASAVIEYLLEKARGTSSFGVAYLYFDYRQRHDQKAWILLGNLWAQMFRRRGPSATEIDQTFGEVLARHESSPSSNQIVNMIRDELASGSLERFYVVIDALDECGDESERNVFLDRLQSLQPPINVLITSRTKHLDDCGLADVRAFDFAPTTEDMSTYINARIRENKKLWSYVGRRPELEEDIRRIIIERANGMFLLCRMHLDSISKAITLKGLKDELRHIPRGENVLKETYDRAVERIRDQGGMIESFALGVIRWVCSARRPLKLAELLCALAVEPGDEGLDEDALADENDITNYCAGLVVVEGESKTVRFVHYTTQEYFNSLRETDEFVHSHGDIARICTTVLGFKELTIPAGGQLAQIWSSSEEMPFFTYAALNFGYHFRQELRAQDLHGDDESLQDTTDMLHALLNNPQHVQRVATAILLNIHGRIPGFMQDPNTRKHITLNATAIHIAAFFNVLRHNSEGRPFGVNLEWLVENEGKVADYQKPMFGNALHWACLDNSVESIQILLSSPAIELDAHLPIAGPVGWTPSFVSVAYGSLGTLQALLDYGVNIYQPLQNEYRGTLLQAAIEWAHTTKGPSKTASIDAIMKRDAISRLLVQTDVYANTALMEAVRTADYSVFECVMGYYENAPWPPQLKHQAILASDCEGRTALHWVLSDSSLRFKNPDRSTVSGPLRMLEALLDTPFANSLLQRRDRKRDTPFEGAIRLKHIQAVETIFEKHKQHGFTDFYPSQLESGLNLAARVADTPMIETLLSKLNYELPKRPNEETVLHHAAGGNRPENMEFILQKLAGFHLYNVPGPEGNSPLHYAAASGNLDALTALLGQEGIDVNLRNDCGQTALHVATSKNLVDACSTLLKAGADINARDDDGVVAAIVAIENRYPEVLAVMIHYPLAKFGDDDLDADDIAWLEQQPWGHDLLSKPSPSSKLTTRPEYWPRGEEDIVEAALCLKRKLGGQTSRQGYSSAYLTSLILDMAEYWVRSSSVRISLKEDGEVRRWGDPPTPYLMSRAIVGRLARPVRRVVFEITGHDQGYCSDPSRGVTWTWFTADVHRRENSVLNQELSGPQDQGGANREIYLVHNRGANWQWHTHKLSWNLMDMTAADAERGVWIRGLTLGDRIVILAHARYPGWENWVQRAKIDVFTTCLKSQGEYVRDVF
ncbi:ankyrin [Durotheca rogersii]|uniref:ankyrin n=1 Tax=Durotheca rogersii TaxID=419775 RepID=UPI002220FA4A|nr:ankyrin [Durotheca rogersii]KAI5860154.1 ankyrin [Durotheca rogersii]